MEDLERRLVDIEAIVSNILKALSESSPPSRRSLRNVARATNADEDETPRLIKFTRLLEDVLAKLDTLRSDMKTAETNCIDSSAVPSSLNRDATHISTEAARFRSNTPPQPQISPAPIQDDTQDSSLQLSTSQLGLNFISTIQNLTEDIKFSNIVSVQPIEINWEDLQLKFSPTDSFYYNVNYQSNETSKGYTHLFVSKRKSRLQWPDMHRTSRPTQTDILAFLESTINHPPGGSISYYGGGSSNPMFDSLLHPGEILQQAPILLANSCFWHIGEHKSATALHKEDADFWSANLNLIGWKIFVIIHRDSAEKLEKLVREKWPGSTECHQFIRHQSLLIAPSQLRQHGIDFQVVCAGQNDLVLTRPGEYHYVINYTSSVAISTNFLLPGAQLLPEEVLVCEKCGLFGLKDRPEIRDVSSAPAREPPSVKRCLKPVEQSTSDEPSRKRSAIQAGTAALERDAMMKEITRIDLPCGIPGHVKDLLILKVVSSIWSRSTLEQFFCFSNSLYSELDYKSPLSSDFSDRVQQRLERMDALSNRTGLYQLILRIERRNFYEDIENSKNGRLRAAPDVRKNLFKNTTKGKVDNHLKIGRVWYNISKGYNGLLSFIPEKATNTFNISTKHFESIAGDPGQLTAFHSALKNEYTNGLCIAGQMLEKAISSSVQLLLERENFDVYKSTEAEILSHLRSITIIPS